MHNAVIVDDESSGREIIRHLLKKTGTEIEVIGEADSVTEAIALIGKEEPDLIFLDVEMPTGTGFDVLREFPELNSEVIFVTAYDKYAIEAFRFNAIDYLLKPIEKEDFTAAVQKASELIERKQQGKRISLLLESIRENTPKKERIVLPTQEGFEVIQLEELIWCQGDGAYTRFNMTDNRQFLVSKMLKDYDSLLQNQGFFRIHRSYLINLNHVVRYFKGKGGDVELTDGSVLAVSRDKKDEFISKMF